MPEHATARLIQHEVAQGLIPRDETALFPDRIARRGQDAAHDDITHLALGMGGNDVNCLAGSHRQYPPGYA